MSLSIINELSYIYIINWWNLTSVIAGLRYRIACSLLILGCWLVFWLVCWLVCLLFSCFWSAACCISLLLVSCFAFHSCTSCAMLLNHQCKESPIFLASSGVFSTAKGAFFDCYGGFLRPLQELSSTATEAFFDCYGSFLRLLCKLSSTATGAFFDCYGSFLRLLRELLRLLHEHLLLLRELLGCLLLGSSLSWLLVVCFWAASSFLVALLFVAGFVSISSPFVSRWFAIFGLRAGS